jgi:hypothetical protein
MDYPKVEWLRGRKSPDGGDEALTLPRDVLWACTRIERKDKVVVKLLRIRLPDDECIARELVIGRRGVGLEHLLASPTFDPVVFAKVKLDQNKYVNQILIRNHWVVSE